MERAERTLVVFLVLATAARADDSLDSKALCPKEQSKRECALTYNNRGGAEFAAGIYPEAELAFASAISLWASETLQSDDLAKGLHNLAAVYRAEGRNSDAASVYQSALDLRELLVGSTDVTLLPILNELGLVYLDLADVARAEHILERASRIAKLRQAEDTIPGADALNNLAMAYRQQGRLLCAEELFSRALAVYRQTPDAKRTVTALNNLGRTLADEAKLKEAERLYREAVAMAERDLGPAHPDAALSYSNLGKLLAARQKFSDAEPLLRRAERIDRENFPASTPRVAYDLHNEAVVAAGLKHFCGCRRALRAG